MIGSVKLLDLQPDQCRWPLWAGKTDGKARGFPHCGNKTEPGSSYCWDRLQMACDLDRTERAVIRAARSGTRGKRLGQGREVA